MYAPGVRRTQIYLDERADEQLRQRAVAEGRSAAAVIREALDAYLTRTLPAARGTDPIRAMAGSLRGLPADAAAEHDRDLYGRPRGASASHPPR
jgi:hypothetical protein